MPLSTDFLNAPRTFCMRYICIMPGTTTAGPSCRVPGLHPSGVPLLRHGSIRGTSSTTARRVNTSTKQGTTSMLHRYRCAGIRSTTSACSSWSKDRKMRRPSLLPVPCWSTGFPATFCLGGPGRLRGWSCPLRRPALSQTQFVLSLQRR